MNNKNILTDKLGEIDSKFLDEYHDRRNHRGVRRKTVMKYCSIAASVMIVITISLATMLTMFRNTPAGNPVDTSNGVINNADYSNYTVIYAKDKDYSLGDIVESEVYIEPPQPGEVRFSGELYEKIKSDELYENSLFAVRMSFSMEFEKSEEYETLHQERYDFWLLLWEKYDNEIVPHYKSHSLSHGGMDITCEECLRLSDIHKKDLADYNAMGEHIRSIEESDKAAHAEKVKEHAEAYIASLGLEFKNVKVIWSNDPEKVDEFTEVWKVQFTYFTKEQLASFEASEDLGIEFTLVPEWMDTEEAVIYRSNGLYPVTLE